MSISNTVVLVTLNSGNAALYEVQPQHLNMQDRFIGPAASTPLSLRDVAIQFGRQLAHEWNGVWFRPGGWTPINGFEVPKGVARA